MTRTLGIVMALVVSALAARDLAAQWGGNVERLASTRNQVYTTFGSGPAGVGYARQVSLFGEQWQLGAEVGRRDARVRLETRTTLVGWRSLRLVGSMGINGRGSENSIYRAFNFGADFGVAPGLYRGSWYLAGEFGLDKAVITHIAHSDWYRENVSPNANDGWHLNTSGTVHYGVAGGVAIGRTELAGRAGWRQAEDFSDAAPATYAGLAVGFRF